MYAELHCHSAFSFLDGASLPDELVPAALALGHDTLALTDHNSVSGSMEFAVSARALGLRPIHGAEVDLDDGRHLTLLVRDARGWSNLCRILTRAHAHTRDGRPGAPATDPSIPLQTVLDHAEGLVCLSGCALRGVHDEPTLRRLRDAFGPQSPARRAAAAVPARRPGPQPPPGRAGPPAGGGVRGHRQRARSCPPSGPAAGRVRGGAPAHHAGCLRASAAGELQPCAGGARGDGGTLCRISRGGGRDGPAGRRAALRPRQRSRLPVSRGRGRRRHAHAGRAVRHPPARALRHGVRRYPRAGGHAPGGGDADHRLAGPARFLPAAPRHARAGPRGGGGGARNRERPRAAAARARSRARACRRSSAFSPGSRTWTRSPTSCSSGASSTTS